MFLLLLVMVMLSFTDLVLCSYSVCCMVVNAAWISCSFFCITVDVAWFSINVLSTALWTPKLLYSFCIGFVNVLSLLCILDYQLSILCCVNILQNNKKLWRHGALQPPGDENLLETKLPKYLYSTTSFVDLHFDQDTSQVMEFLFFCCFFKRL